MERKALEDWGLQRRHDISAKEAVVSQAEADLARKTKDVLDQQAECSRLTQVSYQRADEHRK